MVVRSLVLLVSTVSALDYSSLEVEEGAGRQIFTSGGVAYLALNQTFALLIGRSLYTIQPTLAPAKHFDLDIMLLKYVNDINYQYHHPAIMKMNLEESRASQLKASLTQISDN